MTTDDKQAVSPFELASMRNNLNLLRSQVKTGRIDEAFLTRQIDKLSTLLERVEAEQKHHSQSGRFEALYNVSRALGSSLELQTVLDQVMDAIIQLTNAERGFLMLRDDDGGLAVKAARNFDQQTLSSDKLKFSRTVVNQVMDTRMPILTTNASEDPRFAAQASVVAQSLRSVMATPLRARGTVIGAVYVDNRAMAGLFKDSDLDALDAFSGQAAIAVDNALLFNATDQELSRRVEELRQLRRIDLLLNETLDADKAIAFTLEWACRLSGASGGYLGLTEGKPPVMVRTVQQYGIPEDVARPERLDEAYPQVWEAIKGDKPLSYTSDGQTLLMMPIHRQQDIVGVVVLQSNAAFSDEQQDLVARVMTRAAVAIENARLYAAVQTADKAKSEFVGIVAHDLKAPMTSIKGYAELMLMMGGMNDRESDFLNRVRDTVRRMEVLVSDLADISRIESGHFFMEISRISVADIVQAVKDSSMPQIQARNHTFVDNVEPDLPDMEVDYYRLLQVLTNLVSNAYKYTPDSGMITLTAHQVNQRVEFSVADTGIGLSEKDVAMMGTKFWRAEDKYTRSQPGTGLGFSITRNLIEQMGSHIEIDSEVGKGSKFTFSVPIAKG